MAAIDSKTAMMVSTGMVCAYFLSQYLSKPAPKSYKISYFGGRGLGELARTLCVISGTEFEDDRRGEPTTFEKEPANLGRLPILEVRSCDNVLRVGQKGAICRYLGKSLGLAGSNEEEEAMIDMLCEHTEEMKTQFGKNIWPYAKDPIENWEEKWFDSPVEAKERSDRCLQWFLHKIETFVGDDGFAVGGKFSRADAVLYNVLGEVCTDLPEKLYTGAPGSIFFYPFNGPSYERTRDVMEKVSPKVLRIVENFRDEPKMQAYLNNRGTQMF